MWSECSNSKALSHLHGTHLFNQITGLPTVMLSQNSLLKDLSNSYVSRYTGKPIEELVL